MVEKFRRIQKRLHLDSHSATERFGVVLAMFSVSLIALTAGLGASAVANTREQIAATALYTPTFTTSLTSLAGEVPGVYVSPDRTRALVMMSFGASAGDQLSIDAKNYQAFVAGSTTKMEYVPLLTELSGQIVRFGSTGYFGVVLDSATGFPEQILNLTMRSNSTLVYTAGENAAVRQDLYDDSTFLDFDQWRVYVNPGASDAVVLESLSGAGEPLEPVDVYYDLVVREQEEVLRAELDRQLAQMQVEQFRIEEYTAQLASTEVAGLSLVAPDVPAQIEGDTVVGTPGSQEEPLTLRSTWTAPTGYDFDWRSGDVRSGYLDALMPADTSYVRFLSDKASETDQDGGYRATSRVWELSDGSNLADHRSGDGVLAPLVSVMNNLSAAYDGFYASKATYQTAGLQSLINLEVQLRNVERSTSINDDQESLLTY